MSDITRRNVLNGVAAAGGLVAAAAASDANADGQPPFGPTPPVLAGAELPSFRFPLGSRPAKTWTGGWAKEATVAEFPVSEKLAGVLMQLDAGRRCANCTGTPTPRSGPMCIKGQCRVTTIDPQGHSEIVDFGAGRRLVFPARPRPLDPGHRPRGLPVRAGLRQRLFLRVRHLQHQRLDRPYAARGAGRRTSACRRETFANFPKRRSTSRRGRCRRRCRPILRRDRSAAARSRTATACWRRSPTVYRGRHESAWCRSASSRSRRR